ncbi:MAG: hypothetical protein LQ344_004955 [Seirophora lacunosa]|nr:MAG: hypothetical protein LQ344_004955 [Seirophora lacunosa]
MPFAHLKNTTSTPPPSSSNITAWVEQLPTPPQAYVRLATSRQLVPISANPRRPQPDHGPKALAAKKCLKRRARSPLPQDRSSKRKAVAAPESTPIQRRSARLVSLQAKMTQRKGSDQRDDEARKPPIGNGEQEQGEESLTRHAMDTRGRTLALRGFPSTPNHPTVASLFNDAPVHFFPPATTSRKSSSPGKSAIQSSSKSPSKSRTGSPSKSGSAASSKEVFKKEQLTQMSPSVRFGDISLIKDARVPTQVKEFWINYMMLAVHELKVVPKELKSRLEDMYNTPMKTQGPVNEFFYAAGLYSAADLPLVLDTVRSVVKAAHAQRNSHEPQWVSKIVTPIMSRLQTLSSSVSAKGRGIEDLNISSVQIAPPELFPTSLVDGFKDANKKADYALALALTDEEERILSSAVTKYLVSGGTSINQTRDWTSAKPMFESTEVKVDARDSWIQIAVWICAELEKRRLERYELDLPIPAIAIENDHWSFSIAHAIKISPTEQTPGGKPYRVQFFGPVEIGSTKDAAGVFKILHVLKAIVRWGLEVYEPQFMKHVFARYK